MQRKSITKLCMFLVFAATTALGLGGCSDGKDGAAGASGVDRTLGVVEAGKLTAVDLKDNALDGKITSVDMTGNQPVVKFQVYNKSNRQGIVGLRTFSLHIAQLKPELNGSNSYWQNYISAGLPLAAIPAYAVRTAPTVPVAPAVPSADAVSLFNTDGSVKAKGYSVVDNGDGSYAVTFGADIKANTNVPYDASLVHRVAIGVRSVAVPGVIGKTPGAYAGPINPETGTVMGSFLNTNGTALVYDFVPATGAAYKDATTGSDFARDIVTIAACNQCHGRLEHGSNNTSGHFGSRPDTKVCVVCHTPQLSAIAEFGEGDFTTFIHKIHMGNRLPATETAPLTHELEVNEFALPMDPRNCTICHKGTDVDSWKTKPSKKACGSCHNSSDLTAHQGGQANDNNCSMCHTAAFNTAKHATDYATPNNPQTPAGLVNFKYDIKSVAVNATNQAVITFKILSDGGTGAAMTPVVFTGAGSSANTPPLNAVLTGFSGSPGFILAYNKSTPNQTFTTSVDYNNLGVKAAQPVSISIATLLNGTKGTLSTPDADGYYTATINADASVAPVAPTSFPAGAKMRTVALQGYFTQPAATDRPESGRHTISVVKTVGGDTARRVVIDSGKCGACHEVFEGHGGNRNIGKDTVGEAVCTLCHVPNLSTSGRTLNLAGLSATQLAQLTTLGYSITDTLTYNEESNNFKDMIHGIHAGNNAVHVSPLKFVRGDRFAIINATWSFPGILKNCEACHTATSYKTIPANAMVTTDKTSDGTDATVAAVTAARVSVPNTTDLVTTPFTAACVSCHQLASTKAHMVQNGGRIKVPRFAGGIEEKGADEACATCHGTTGTASIYNSHRF